MLASYCHELSFRYIFREGFCFQTSFGYQIRLTGLFSKKLSTVVGGGKGALIRRGVLRAEVLEGESLELN